MRNTRFLICTLVAALLAPTAVTQEPPSPAGRRPAPRVTGRLVGTDGIRQLILEYETASGKKTFIGNIHSTCVLPAKSTTSQPTPLQLSAIPKGSDVTLFYVRHKQKQSMGGRTENTVLAIRFDRLNAKFDLLKGQTVSCFKGSGSSAQN